MHRFLYFAGFAYIALCGAIVARQIAAWRSAADLGVQVAQDPPTRTAPSEFTSGQQWFARMKPFCNAVEVDVRMRFSPPPSTGDGAGYAAACYALAGKMDRARNLVEGLAPRARPVAANVLFEVAHPVADAGDDRASGPMMELVLEYWPNNYMALYHAGMSEYSLGQVWLAEKHLRAFLQMYTTQDGFHQNAQQALRAMTQANNNGRLRLRPRVEREPQTRP